MRPKTISVTMAALDRNGVSTAQQLAAAGDMLLDGALSAGYDRNGLVTASTPTAAGTMAMNGALYTAAALTTFSSARYLVIYSDGDDSGVTFTITGTDANKNVIYDKITGPNTTATRSALKFLTVTNVHISAAGTGNIEVGSMGVGTMDYARHVSLYCAGDMSGVTFTIYGTDRFGQDMSEDVTGPNATTVSSTYNFKTVTRVYADGAVGTNVEVGSYDELETQWIPVDRCGGDITVDVALSTSASMVYTVQHTLTPLQTAEFMEYDATAQDHDSLAGETTSNDGKYSSLISGLRLQVEDFVSGTATMTIIQAR